MEEASDIRYIELSSYEGYERDLIKAMKFPRPAAERFVCDAPHSSDGPEIPGMDPKDLHLSSGLMAARAKELGSDGWALRELPDQGPFRLSQLP